MVKRLVCFVLLLGCAVGPVAAQSAPPLPPGPFLSTPEIPGFRFKARITGEPGRLEDGCIEDTLCVSGGLPGRSELFIRVIGPRPNGFLWVNLVRFTPSEAEIWIEQRSTGAVQYYRLPSLPRSSDTLSGRVDREAFRPGSSLPAGGEGVALIDRTDRLEPVIGTPLGRRARFVPPTLPDYRFTVRILSNGQEIESRREPVCISETVCVSGAIPGRSELFLRIIGPRPNGFFHVNVVRFTPSRVEITIERLSTGTRRRYVLPALGPANDTLEGRLDRAAFRYDESGLPPDPGSVNDRTLRGVDSDNDGVRDDVQRFIAFNYAADPDALSALRQTATALEGALTESAAGHDVVDDADAVNRAMECLAAVRPRDTAQTVGYLVSEVIDTEQRLLQYIAFDSSLAGEVFTHEGGDRRLTSCDFQLQNLELRLRREALADAAGVCGEGDDAVVFFVNGVLNFSWQASASAMELEDQLQTSLPRATLDHLTVRSLHNPTYFVLDFWETLRQRQQLAVSRFWRIVAGLEVMPDFFADAFRAYARTLDAVAVVDNFTLLRHVQTYRREIFEGRKVLVVAHSQGNLFANQAYGGLTSSERASFRIVSVATPDSQVAGGGPWTTLTGDLVIRTVRPLFSSLPATTPGPHRGDLLGHGFIESYLEAGQPAKRRILNQIEQGLATLVQPEGRGGEGIITVTLTWGSQPDVDLHVFEPSGTHVYYLNPRGRSGFLDVDDVTSFGPEHYFASCDSLETGTYRVGVNYFRGSAPEDATVQIQAGLANRTFRRHLSAARGTLGNGSPVPVARIVVTGNREEGYEFSVIEN